MIAALGGRRADPLREVGEVEVELVLEQGGAGAGAAVAHLPALEQDGVNPLLREPVAHQRAGDSPADDGEVAAPVLVELGVGGREAALDEPEGDAAGEIHGVQVKAAADGGTAEGGGGCHPERAQATEGSSYPASMTAGRSLAFSG